MVLFEDWRAKDPDERAHCAICGETAEPSDFDNEAQREHLQAQALAHLTGQLDDAFRSATPRRERIGFFEVRLTYKPGVPPIIVPAKTSPAMTQLSSCEVCECRYASAGAAFFCAACGHDSARTTFAGASMDLAERLPTLMDDRDSAADVARHIAEDAVGDAEQARMIGSGQRLESSLITLLRPYHEVLVHTLTLARRAQLDPSQVMSTEQVRY